MNEPFDLRVVPLASIVPHEESEPRRVAKIVGRLAADTVLANPPVVAEVGERLVLLDGANRVGALRVLDYRYAIVQVVRPADLRLEMWHHALLDATPDKLLATLRGAPDVELHTPDGAVPGERTVCRVLLADGRPFVAVAPAGVHRLASMNSLVRAYTEQAVVRRTTEPDLAVHPDAAAVVAFPRLSADGVFDAVATGLRLPAGITRFVLPNRVLLLNAALAPLRSEHPAGELNEWLTGLVAGRRAEGRVRHYPEAVYVLDD